MATQEDQGYNRRGDEMKNRNFWQELIGMSFYVTDQEEYFYAWGWSHAEKKRPDATLCLVTDCGERIHIKGT